MSSAPVYVETRRNPGCLLQLLWFAFIGIWLGQAWMVVAWVLMLSIIGLPLGIAMLNMLPKVIALREPTHQVGVVRRADGRMALVDVDVPQVNFLLRTLYFLLVGWWLSALWMEVAYLLTATVIGIPLGFWMFDRVPAVLTLRR
ncbi:MAG TPA: YccF domain-containing protein [Anaerolinea sp.]|nr:YccF domain-containing protein [Anaerolinea sp.]